MRRRKHEVEAENHERWLVSYADFITLLLAFFVVMYSISSINQGKYRVFSDALTTAFKGGEGMKLAPVADGTMRPDYASWWQIPVSPLPATADPDSQKRQQERKELQQLQQRLTESMSGLIGQGQVDVQMDGDWLLIEMRSGLLFDLGSDAPSRSSALVLDQLAQQLVPINNYLRVRGYTDNLPITTPRFPSNWELSTARAASVVRMLKERGVLPQRMAAEGYAEFAPIADNQLPEGRAKNRRVVLAIATRKYHSDSPLLPQTVPPPGTVAVPLAPVANGATPQLKPELPPTPSKP